MSRIGKIPLAVPKEVKVSIEGSAVRMEGPKGKLLLNIPYGIKVEQKESRLVVTRQTDTKQYRANHGTVRSILKNMLLGVTQGYKKELEIQGLGFRAQVQGNKLTLNLGFSHQVDYEVNKSVKILVPKPTSIILEGPDKALVGQEAAKIRDFKRPEPYKGKGIRYLGEYVKHKQGKSVTK